MAIEVKLKIPATTEQNPKSRKVTFTNTDDPPLPDVVVAVSPVSATVATGLLVKGKNYKAAIQTTDQAGNESIAVNFTPEFLALDTQAPDPDAAPEILGMNEVPDAP